MEEQIEEENLGTATRALPEETIEESQIIESSPKIQEPEEFIKDLISLNQYLQDESPPIVPIKDLFPEIGDPSFHCANPVDIAQPRKVNLISIGLVPDTPSFILLYPTNHEPFSLPYQTNSEPTSYFLPFPDTSSISRIIRLHLAEISILHAFITHVRFASYFWHTLWNLLGVHCKFSCACQARIKPREPIIY